ncbi:MAG: hypothetical protein P9X24_19230 [Candidatus Hatepunaea meridiana]|nr:hypothetical protein [Candidatus Hatepunaea meridiana]
MVKKLLFILVCFILLCFPLLIQAEDKAETEDAERDIGKWWNKSSLTYSPMIKNFLIHSEISSCSYTKHHGNAEGFEYTGLFLFSMRQNRFTYYMFCQLSKEDIEIPFMGAMMLTEDSFYDNVLRTDLFKNLYLDLGWRWERNTERMIENRYVKYAGLGTYHEILPIYNTSLIAGIGQMEEEYDRSTPIVPATLEDDERPVFFLIQNGWINLDPWGRTSLRDRLIYRIPLDDSEAYQIILKYTFDFAITKFLSVSYQYELDYFGKVWPMVGDSDEKHIYGLTVKFDWKSGDKLIW